MQGAWNGHWVWRRGLDLLRRWVRSSRQGGGFGRRWADHLPPWVSWCCLAAGGVFSMRELLPMALPLLAAGGVEAAGLDLSRWRRHIEAVSLLVVAGCWFAKVGWVMTLVLLIFTLCGVRLSLPRGKAQGRQALLLAFLLFLLTAVANTSISFLPFALLWTAAAARVMLLHNWGGGAGQRANPPVPMRRALAWTAAAGLLASLVFLVVPRRSPGWSPPFGASAFGGGAAPELAGTLSLGGGGAIRGGGAVVARIMPPKGLSPAERREMESRMPLLTGFRMEVPRRGRWERGGYAPRRRDVELHKGEGGGAIAYFASPTPTGLIPLPQGLIRVSTPQGMGIELSGGGAVRWGHPPARPAPFSFDLGPVVSETIAEWQAERRGLVSADPATSRALDWSLRVAPPTEGMTPDRLAELLANDLLTFRYTLGNPSGGANDPLGDFLTRTKAGHCEYFAHALASALRHRGVASRVVVGYRLGSWIEAGGYWLVTQNEGHSWVEYVDPDKGEWVTMDPTPSEGRMGGRSLSKRLGQMADAALFRWDRYVVLFSGAEQREGLSWARAQFADLRSVLRGMGPREAATFAVLIAMAAMLAILFALWAKRGKALFRPSGAPGAVLALRPLIRASGVQPFQGETMRSWINRLGIDRPDRRAPLAELADLVEGSVYGGSPEETTGRAAAEARAWKRKTKGGADSAE